MTAPTTAEAAPEQPTNTCADEVQEARSAVAVGVWVSAARCTLTYLVAPLLGAFGVALLGPAAVVLQLMGAVTSTAGAVRMHRLGHRWWPVYAAVAAVVVAVSGVALLERVR